MSSITNISTSPSDRGIRLLRGVQLSWARQHSRAGSGLELVYRSVRPLVRPIRQPAQSIVHNTVQQTVVHLHQTTHQHVFNHVTAAGSGAAELIVRQTSAPPVPEHNIDPSRPALVASKLLRVLSADSAQKVVQPFFYRIIQSFLEQEREIRPGRPSQSPRTEGPELNRADFQALVRSVTDAIDRRNRRNLLRRGGNG